MDELNRAAELRANGIGWNEIGRMLNCRPDICQSWPRLYPRTWAYLLAEATREMLHLARSEAIQTLRRLLRSTNQYSSLAAAKTILKLTANALSRLSVSEGGAERERSSEPPQSPVPLAEAPKADPAEAEFRRHVRITPPRRSRSSPN